MVLNSTDPLGRGVFSGKQARRARNGNIGHNTFLEAVVTVGDARENGRGVSESPRLGNPYHGDIKLPLGGGEDQRDEQTQHATALAAVAVWRPRP